MSFEPLATLRGDNYPESRRSDKIGISDFSDKREFILLAGTTAKVYNIFSIITVCATWKNESFGGQVNKDTLCPIKKESQEGQAWTASRASGCCATGNYPIKIPTDIPTRAKLVKHMLV